MWQKCFIFLLMQKNYLKCDAKWHRRSERVLGGTRGCKVEVVCDSTRERNRKRVETDSFSLWGDLQDNRHAEQGQAMPIAPWPHRNTILSHDTRQNQREVGYRKLWEGNFTMYLSDNLFVKIAVGNHIYLCCMWCWDGPRNGRTIGPDIHKR